MPKRKKSRDSEDEVSDSDHEEVITHKRKRTRKVHFLILRFRFFVLVFFVSSLYDNLSSLVK